MARKRPPSTPGGGIAKARCTLKTYNGNRLTGTFDKRTFNVEVGDLMRGGKRGPVTKKQLGYIQFTLKRNGMGYRQNDDGSIAPVQEISERVWAIEVWGLPGSLLRFAEMDFVVPDSDEYCTTNCSVPRTGEEYVNSGKGISIGAAVGSGPETLHPSKALNAWKKAGELASREECFSSEMEDGSIMWGLGGTAHFFAILADGPKGERAVVGCKAETVGIKANGEKETGHPLIEGDSDSGWKGDFRFSKMEKLLDVLRIVMKQHVGWTFSVVNHLPS